jgi:hypothetical protein
MDYRGADGEGQTGKTGDQWPSGQSLSESCIGTEAGEPYADGPRQRGCYETGLHVSE